MRTDPPVSVPIATGARPRATADGRAGRRAAGRARPVALCGFTGVPKCGFRPMPEKANSVMLTRPTVTMPAAASAATTGGVGRRRRASGSSDARARGGRQAGKIEQVLPDDRDAIEQAEHSRPPRKPCGGRGFASASARSAVSPREDRRVVGGGDRRQRLLGEPQPDRPAP